MVRQKKNVSKFCRSLLLIFLLWLCSHLWLTTYSLHPPVHLPMHASIHAINYWLSTFLLPGIVLRFWNAHFSGKRPKINKLEKKLTNNNSCCVKKEKINPSVKIVTSWGDLFGILIKEFHLDDSNEGTFMKRWSERSHKGCWGTSNS